MRLILCCVLLQNEVLQSPIRIKMISVAIRQFGCHPWRVIPAEAGLNSIGLNLNSRRLAQRAEYKDVFCNPAALGSL